MLVTDVLRERNLDRAKDLVLHGRIKPEDLLTTAEDFNKYMTQNAD